MRPWPSCSKYNSGDTEGPFETTALRMEQCTPGRTTASAVTLSQMWVHDTHVWALLQTGNAKWYAIISYLIRVVINGTLINKDCILHAGFLTSCCISSHSNLSFGHVRCKNVVMYRLQFILMKVYQWKAPVLWRISFCVVFTHLTAGWQCFNISLTA